MNFLEREGLVLEWTPKYRTSNTPNIECLNIELSKHHILAQNRTSQKTEQFMNIELFISRQGGIHKECPQLFAFFNYYLLDPYIVELTSY